MSRTRITKPVPVAVVEEEPKAKKKRENAWTEADYKKAGKRRVKLTLDEDVGEYLDAFAEEFHGGNLSKAVSNLLMVHANAHKSLKSKSMLMKSKTKGSKP